MEILRLKSLLAAASIVLAFSSTANAASVKFFDTWTDTGSDGSATPVLTITEAGVNTFTVDYAAASGATRVSSAIWLVFDVKPVDTMGISASSFALGSGGTFETTPTKVAPSAFGNALKGTSFSSASDWSFAISLDKKDNIGAENSLSFTLSSTNSLLLSDFSKVAVRAQRQGLATTLDPDDRGGSDKLVATTSTVVNPVPLPAAAWMLLAGLGGIAAMKRRKKA